MQRKQSENEADKRQKTKTKENTKLGRRRSSYMLTTSARPYSVQQSENGQLGPSLCDRFSFSSLLSMLSASVDGGR